ncbi:acyltransferase family protein [Demequina subtropica]|uniref:acyltransferase family protein n=1 Tax=Demequina subtropica TaxID=1638989 RepID=UPI001E5E5669|nr:acyltransferase family protein [Demequina subtropica]
MRPEIQGLRALAVSLVVLYHVWPDRLTGGYVGVDVFFVISGYLITAHIAREVARTGRVRLGTFWARRVRRLLPASLTVLLATAVTVLLAVPQAYWNQFMREIGAGTLYVQNWALASASVDYLTAENVASPVQHFWSLSVEEQFYLAWPLLITAVLAIPLGRRLGAAWRMRLLLGAIVVSSLIWGILQTANAPSVAYFSTFVRAWEFAAGGLLAVAGATAWRHEVARRLVSWLGLAAIVWSAFVYTSATPFPGAAALVPVVGTLAILAAGDARGPGGTHVLYDRRSIQWLGDVSYSVYLWHWPFVVLVPLILGRTLVWPERVAMLVVVLGLAWSTKKLIEDPFRSPGAGVRARLPRTFGTAALGMLVVLAVAWTGMWTVERQTTMLEDSARIAAGDCRGAAAVAPDGSCAPVANLPLFPPPAVAADDYPVELYGRECRTGITEVRVKPCEFGDPEGAVDVVLVGDSHAAQWFPAVETLARDHGWRLTVYFKATCPYAATAQDWTGDSQRESCARWNIDTEATLATEPPDLVFTSALATHEFGDGVLAPEVAIEGYAESWRRLTDAGAHVIALVDDPHMPQDQLDCVARAASVDPDAAECGVPRHQALGRADVLTPAAAHVDGAEAVDLNGFLCDDSWCPAVVGRTLAYRDAQSHLTSTYVSTLTPYLAREVPERFLAEG